MTRERALSQQDVVSMGSLQRAFTPRCTATVFAVRPHPHHEELSMKRAGYIFVYLITLVALVSYAGIGMAAKPEGKQQEIAQKHQDKQDKMEAKGAGKQHGKGHHHNGKDLVGAKIKTNGHHVLEAKGDVTASVDVKDGKIAGLQAKHAKKGDLPVKKYKTNKQMAQTVPLDGIARSQTVQDQFL